MDQASPSEKQLIKVMSGGVRIITVAWTEETKATAIKLFNEKRSMSEIGEAVGRTRSAIAGMLKRERESGNTTIKRSKDNFKASNKARTTPPLQKVEKVFTYVNFKAPPLVPEAKVHRLRLRMIDADHEVTLVELKEDSCRWPLGDPKHPDFRFCGCQKSNGPYCTEHHRQSVVSLSHYRRPLIQKTAIR